MPVRPPAEENAMSDPAEVFRRLTHGVYVVGAAHGGRRDAFTAAWLMQVSFDPLLVALSMNPGNATAPLLLESGRFAVSVLARGQLDLARRFGTRSGREEDKLAGVAWRPGHGGAPILDGAAACLECEVTGTHAAGDHRLVLARVVGGRVLREDAVPLGYAETGTMDGSGALFPSSFQGGT
jgi:flavin reductase (DIM6/NTAB) family NADH-FMN oxidoreductase RutF